MVGYIAAKIQRCLDLRFHNFKWGLAIKGMCYHPAVGYSKVPMPIPGCKEDNGRHYYPKVVYIPG
jgi:hypothetical protein